MLASKIGRSTAPLEVNAECVRATMVISGHLTVAFNNLPMLFCYICKAGIKPASHLV